MWSLQQLSNETKRAAQPPLASRVMLIIPHVVAAVNTMSANNIRVVMRYGQPARLFYASAGRPAGIMLFFVFFFVIDRTQPPADDARGISLKPIH